MNILVLDGNQNQAVSSVRSLARAGHTVFVGESSSWSKAGWSRACSHQMQYASPRHNIDAFLNDLVTFVRQHPGILVLPMTEATTLQLSEHRESLIAVGAQFVLPEHKDLLRAFDKVETTRLAASLGVAVPKTLVISNPQEAREVSPSLPYPVVLKARASEDFRSGKLRPTGRPLYARNATEFDHAYGRICDRCSSVLVQEFVPGAGMGYFALMDHGELRAEFAHRRIRDVIPTGSGSALRVSVAPDPEIRRASLAILSALRWNGVAMVEFRKQSALPAIFMEVNGRFWHSLALACYAGVDFPGLLAQMAEHGDLETVTNYQRGVRCRWVLGDVRHLVEVWKGPPRGYPGRYPGRLQTLIDFLTPVSGTRHDMFQWRDPLPEAGDWLHFSAEILRRLKGR